MAKINEHTIKTTLNEIMKGYKIEVEQIYKDLAHDLKFAVDHNQDKTNVLKVSNAMLSAAGRRARVDLMLACLGNLKDQKIDITATVAGNSIDRVMGRKIKNETLISSFGTPNRTAADKSKVTAEDLAEAEQQMRSALESLVHSMKTMREAISSTFDFPSRKKR